MTTLLKVRILFEINTNCLDETLPLAVNVFIDKQASIPVGCVPPACCPYPMYMEGCPSPCRQTPAPVGRSPWMQTPLPLVIWPVMHAEKPSPARGQNNRRLWKYYPAPNFILQAVKIKHICDVCLLGADEDAMREEAAREELLEMRNGDMPSAGPSFRRNYIPPPDTEQENVHTEL